VRGRDLSEQEALRREREMFLSQIDLGCITLHEVIALAIEREMAEWAYESCVSRIIRPSYSSIRVTDLTESGFREYILRKFQYHARELFSNNSPVSILGRLFANSSNHNPIPILATILETLDKELSATISPPCVRSLTWSIKFAEQLYFLEVDAGPQGGEESVAIILKPYSRHPGFKFHIQTRTLDRLRKVVGEKTPLSDLLSVVPIVQLQGRKVIFNQPLTMATQDIPIEKKGKENPSSVRVMGVDLGLKHFAVLSIFEHSVATGQKQEIGRHFLDQRRLLGCAFETNTLRFHALHRSDYNIKRRLERLRKQQRALSSIVNQMKDDGGAKRTKEFYYAKKRFKCVWNKVRRIHESLTQHIAHTLIQIAHAYDVERIVFEDLRWSQHSSRREVGGWLSHNQQHFFHSQVIQRVKDMALRHRFDVKCVNAQWSSKVSWTAQLEHNLAITYRTHRSEIEPYMGARNGKLFQYSSTIPSLSWQGDSDLNAARNIALRGLLLV
jgi:transposase